MSLVHEANMKSCVYLDLKTVCPNVNIKLIMLKKLRTEHRRDRKTRR